MYSWCGARETNTRNQDHAGEILDGGVLSAPVSAQAQKVETIKIIVGYAPGGESDRAARLVADAAREAWCYSNRREKLEPADVRASGRSAARLRQKQH